jgi:predicted ATPase
MLKSLEITNFRGFRGLKVKDLANVTVLTGPNGAGKTTLLEAILAIYGRMNPAWVLQLQAHKGFARFGHQGPNYTGLFYGFQDVGNATILGRFSSKIAWKLVIERSPTALATSVARPHGATTELQEVPDLVFRAYQRGKLAHTSRLVWAAPERDGEPPRLLPKNARNLPQRGLLMHPSERVAGPEEAERFGDAKVAGRVDALIKALQIMDPRIVDVEYVRTSVGEYFAVKRDGQAAPIGLLGSGANKLFQLFVNLHYTQGGFLGIDEVENGLYYRHHASIFKHLLMASRQTKTQLVMSTHSAEALRAIAEAAKQVGPGDLAVVHLRRNKDDSVFAKTFRGADAVASLELGYELR